MSGDVSMTFGGGDLTVEDVIVLLVGEIVRRTEQFAGERIDRVTIGRPVHYSAALEGDRLARQRMTDACARLHILYVEFLDEPVAASIGYTHRDAAARRNGTAVVFDFGGGTLDITVVRGTGPDAEVLATGGVPVPQHIIRRLLNWQTAFLLNRPEPLSIIDEVVKTGSRPRELGNPRTLATRNYGAALFRAVEQGKQLLSAAGHTSIELCQPDLEVREILTREEFEGIIREQHRAVEECVADTVQRGGLAPGEITAVVTTGGSSRIPLFRRALRERFANAELVVQDAFTSVAAGLAIYGYRSS